MELALGRVKECPFPNEAVSELKDEIVKVLSSRGLQLRREKGDRNKVPIDFRFLELLLEVAQDPDTQLGTLAQRVKVGPGTRCQDILRYIVPKEGGGWSLRGTRRVGSWKKNISRSTRGDRTVHHWLASQTKLKRCWRIRRAEGKYSSLRNLKPEPVFLMCRCSLVGSPAQRQTQRGSLGERPLRRNSWPGCQCPNANPRPRTVADCGGFEETHEGERRS